ncbi:type I restriction endonuclease, partial [Pelodictyon luteolum]|uniref:type I restriction endonuclease n=1 Tax=Pelodictyon luteolum TaxID=1100 RepID=UPI0026EDEBE6
MDLKDSLKAIADRVSKLKEQIGTEEATKNAFIMPFLQALGYDVFNPVEVVPEFTADIGLKKGEKIDYAIIKDGVPAILIECKHWAQDLNLHDGQLLRYFHVSQAKFGLLTNGVSYRFFSDLVQQNKMDEKPFLEFDITEINDGQLEELKKFHKSSFDVDSIVNTASDLKYTNELKQFTSV